MAQVFHESIPSETERNSSSAGSSTISSLMAMAEYMLCQRPQRISESVQCLLALMTFSPPPRVEARVRLQLGLILYHHTDNLLEARQSLEKAMLSSSIISGLEEIKFEAASVLARIHIEQGYSTNARKVLRSVLDTTHRYPYWHCRLLLQKASIFVKERDFDALLATLTQLTEYSQQIKAPGTRSLCLLTKGVHLLMNRQYQEGARTLSEVCELIESYNGPKKTLLRAFYTIIQVTHLLNAGLMKSAKPHLKQLQQCVKLLSSEPPEPMSDSLNGESFDWLAREQIYVLAYLVCIMHSVLAGCIDKALNYTSKAISLIERNNADSDPIMIVFQAHLLENITVCLLMQGNVTLAGSTLQEVIGVCHNHPTLMYSHRAALHTLLGLYAFSNDYLDRSVSQFLTALQHTNNTELKIFININLAICYMKQEADRDKEIKAIIEGFESENQAGIINDSKNLKGAVSFVRSLNASKQSKLHEAKRQLRETLALSNNNDLNKLTVCSLLLLGKIYLSLGNNKETRDMVEPAFHLSSKIQDKRLQVWATALSIELHHATGEREQERLASESLMILKGNLQKELDSTNFVLFNNLTQWTIGDWPVAARPLPPLPMHKETQPHISDRIEKPEELRKVEKPEKQRRKQHEPSMETMASVRDDNGEREQGRDMDEDQYTMDAAREEKEDVVISGRSLEQPTEINKRDDSNVVGVVNPDNIVGVARNDYQLDPPPRKEKRKISKSQPSDDLCIPEKRIKVATPTNQREPSLTEHSVSSVTSHTTPYMVPNQQSNTSPTENTSTSHTTPHLVPIHQPTTHAHASAPPTGHTPSVLSTGHTPSVPSTGHTPSVPSTGHTPSASPMPIESIEEPIVQSNHDVQTHQQHQLPPNQRQLPTYNESLSHSRPPVRDHTHPITQQQQQLSSSPSHLELYRQQQVSIRQQLEDLKQQQMMFHQLGTASPQQWHQLQAQQQYLLQKKSMVDSQVQQLLMREEQLKSRQQIQQQKQLQQEMERREAEKRRERQLEEKRREQANELMTSSMSRQHFQQQHRSPDDAKLHHQSSLWKPISSITTPSEFHHHKSPPAANSSFLPTPPFSSQEFLSSSKESPSQNMQTPPNQKQRSLSSLLQGQSPSVHSIAGSPDFHSGFHTPNSADHAHNEQNMPVRRKDNSGPTPQSSLDHSFPSASAHRHQANPMPPSLNTVPPPLIPSPGVNQPQNQVGVPEYLNETEALLRQQEHQRRMIQHQQQQQMLQMRQAQDKALFYQQGAAMLPHGFQQLPSGYIQPEMMMRGQQQHPGGIPQQSSAHVHGLMRPGGHAHQGNRGAYATNDQFMHYGKR